jgi:serine/threonine protein kinase
MFVSAQPKRTSLPASVLALLEDDDDDEKIDKEESEEEEKNSSKSGGSSPSSHSSTTLSKSTDDDEHGLLLHEESSLWEPKNDGELDATVHDEEKAGADGTTSALTSYNPLTAASTLSSSPLMPAASSEFPSFRLVRRLGNGGFGAVYAAVVETGPLTGTLVAVKQMPLDTNITREEHVMASLPPSQHCVRYLGTRRTATHVYLVMEFASGGSLRAIRNATGPIPPSMLRRYAYMTLLGLNHLHRHEVIHQDIKGDNVVVNETGNVKIVDFGCAKSMSQQTFSVSGGGGGTVLWMAPEVLRGGKPTSKSDVWSFGCLLLELTNESGSPWGFHEHLNTFQAVHAIANATQPPPIPASMSATARSFVASCLQLDPSKRPTANSLLHHAYFTAAAAEEEAALEAAIMCGAAVSGAPTTAALSSSGRELRSHHSPQVVARHHDASISSAHGFKLEAVSYSDDDDDDTSGAIKEDRGKVPSMTRVSAVGPASPGTAPAGPTIWESSSFGSVEHPGALYIVQEVDSTIAERRKKAATATTSKPIKKTATGPSTPASSPWEQNGKQSSFFAGAPGSATLPHQANLYGEGDRLVPLPDGFSPHADMEDPPHGKPPPSAKGFFAKFKCFSPS